MTAAADPVGPGTARATWRAAEPLHSMVYFAPEPQEEYAALGYDLAAVRALGYFPARAAAMGAVSAETVQATFFNFAPRAVHAGIAGAWDTATPDEVVAARYRGADRALRRLLGDGVEAPEVAEAAQLLQTATQGCSPDGRPLHAGNARLPWPEAPHLRLFHAQTLLREFRGDGHVAACLHEGVSGLEAAVLHVAVGDSWSRTGLQRTRAWTDEEWDGAVARLAERGWLQPDGSFTEEGRAHRARVEDATDRLSLAPYAHLGEDGCARVQELVRPFSRAVVDAGALGIR